MERKREWKRRMGNVRERAKSEGIPYQRSRMTRQANCVISAQRTLPLPPPHLGPLTIIIIIGPAALSDAPRVCLFCKLC